MNPWYEQICATSALIQFMKQRNHFYIPAELHAALEEFRKGNGKAGCEFAYRIRVWGMGSLTDSGIEPLPGEDDSYGDVVFEALVRNWCFWISEATRTNVPYWKRMILAVANYVR